MATISIEKNNIPLKAYLRADPHSQHFKFKETYKELVTHNMFWGTSANPKSIYLDYSEIDSRSIQISEGISANTATWEKTQSQCDEWIDENIYHPNASKLFVIEGYAGCGKTTFINHLIRTYKEPENYILIDIGKSWSYPKEPFMFFNETRGTLDRLLDGILKKPTRMVRRIWDTFFDMTRDLNRENTNEDVVPVIRHIRKIKEKSKPRRFKDNVLDYLQDYFSDWQFQYSQDNPIVWHSRGQTQIVIMLIILLKSAELIVENKENTATKTFSLIFDNLDIITNPAIPAENVLLLCDVINRYINFKEAYYVRTNHNLPDFLILITVRKVLFAHITSHLPDLEMGIPYDMNHVMTVDISNLYSSQSILSHRISFWLDHIDDQKTIEKFSQIKKLISVQGTNSAIYTENMSDYDPKNRINLDELVNHNYRAFSNVLSALLEDPDYNNILMRDYQSPSTENWQKVASIVFSLSLLYRNKSVWTHMGFGCNSFSLVDYPSTLNRLILNYLYAAKQGQNLRRYSADRPDILTNANVPLTDLLNTFRKVKFMPVETKLTEEDLDGKYHSSTLETANLVLERLANMCARMPSSSADSLGYDTDDDELWRRPIYFTGGLRLNHTAANHKELQDHFKKCLEENTANQITFSITDEGFTLINDIVAEFEFYSARYCRINSPNSPFPSPKPLHQAVSEQDIDILIRPVYEAVERCCKRNIVLKDQYMEQYQVSLDKYLIQYFHPRTKPRIDRRASHERLVKKSFRPQLHIVRVIYAHIWYFSKIKDFFAESDLPKKNIMCRHLTQWIAKYLVLYNTYFRDLLEDTICKADNNVYNDLIKLKDQQMQQYTIKTGGKNISIGRKPNPRS